jgi:hypothetical protein
MHLSRQNDTVSFRKSFVDQQNIMKLGSGRKRDKS